MYKLLFFVILVLGCRKDNPTPNLGNYDYDSQVPLVCHDNLSEFYCKATLNGKNLCYSTNDFLYSNWHWFVTAIATTKSAATLIDTSTVKQSVEMGVGGFGSATELAAPIFFFIHVPAFSRDEKPIDAIKRFFIKGKDLDITVSPDSVSNIEIENNKFSIQLFANCPKCNGSVGSFYTWTGIQEKGQSYLKVTDFEQHSDAYIITLQFACKLYDNHGRYYADVKNGEMRLKYTF